jgi:hypothetical protein
MSRNDETPRRYIGTDFGSVGGGTVHIEPSGRILDTGVENPDLPSHSRDGFQVGYTGSGPAQLAAALLYDVYDKQTMNRYYQDFKSEVISGIEGDFELSEAEIREFVQRKQQEA